MNRLTIAALLIPALATGVAAQESSIDLAEARRAFEAARVASDADGGRLWGVELYGPVFLVDPGSRSVVADRVDPEGCSSSDGVWVGTLPESINPANTAIEWAGLRWTMVLWPAPSIPHARNGLLLPEMFHRVPSEVGLPATTPLTAHLDARDGRVWMRLEMRALAEALTTRGRELDAIGDALDSGTSTRAFPERREEDARERNEYGPSTRGSSAAAADRRLATAPP